MIVKETIREQKTVSKYLQVANRVNKLLNVNVFDNKRTLDLVDARSVTCYILNKYYGGTLHSIADFFKTNGKRFDHSTVYYNIQLFERDVKVRRKDIDENLMYLIGTIDYTTHLNIVLDTVLSDEDKERIIKIVNRLANKYYKKSVI